MNETTTFTARLLGGMASAAETATGHTEEFSMSDYNRLRQVLVRGIKEAAGKDYDATEILADIAFHIAPNVSLADMGARVRRIKLSDVPLPEDRHAMTLKLDAAEGMVMNALKGGAYRTSSASVYNEGTVVAFQSVFTTANEVLSQPAQALKTQRS